MNSEAFWEGFYLKRCQCCQSLENEYLHSPILQCCITVASLNFICAGGPSFQARTDIGIQFCDIGRVEI